MNKLFWSGRILILFLFLSPENFVSCSSSDSWKGLDKIEKDVRKQLKRDDDRQQFCPQRLPLATQVNISMLINSASLEDNLCHVDLTMKLKWNNPRITFDNSAHPEVSYVSVNSHTRVWYPDLHFPGELGRKSTTDSDDIDENLLWIYPNGDVFYSVRMHLDLPSQISDVSTNPATRNCTIFVESYRCSSDHLVLSWEEHDPVQLLECEGLPGIRAPGDTPKFMLSSEVVTGKAKEVQVRAYQETETFSNVYAQLQFH